MEQLRSSGVLESVQTNRSWFRMKAPLMDFYLRYRCMIHGMRGAQCLTLCRCSLLSFFSSRPMLTVYSLFVFLCS